MLPSILPTASSIIRATRTPSGRVAYRTFSQTTFTGSDATTQTQQEPLPYFVHRTQTKNLPIYEGSKRGGNLRQTTVRKIEGKIVVLSKQLREVLQLKPEEIRINHLTMHIIIKGHRKREVERFLKEKRF
ncbi:54S ribosomal protein img2, mitochondrial [Rhizina undulata]